MFVCIHKEGKQGETNVWAGVMKVCGVSAINSLSFLVLEVESLTYLLSVTLKFTRYIYFATCIGFNLCSLYHPQPYC